MRYFLIILFMLAGLNGYSVAAGEQAAEGGDSTPLPAETAAGSVAGKQPDEKTQGDRKKSEKKKSTGGEEEPDCE